MSEEGRDRSTPAFDLDPGRMAKTLEAQILDLKDAQQEALLQLIRRQSRKSFTNLSEIWLPGWRAWMMSTATRRSPCCRTSSPTRPL